MPMARSVLLGWQTLKRLHIIHEDFPKPIPMAGVENLKTDIFTASCTFSFSIPDSPMPHTTDLMDCKCRKILSIKDLNLQADPISNNEATMVAFPIVF